MHEAIAFRAIFITNHLREMKTHAAFRPHKHMHSQYIRLELSLGSHLVSSVTILQNHTCCDCAIIKKNNSTFCYSLQ